jgi:hypothetical protein
MFWADTMKLENQLHGDLTPVTLQKYIPDSKSVSQITSNKGTRSRMVTRKRASDENPSIKSEVDFRHPRVSGNTTNPLNQKFIGLIQCLGTSSGVRLACGDTPEWMCALAIS